MPADLIALSHDFPGKSQVARPAGWHFRNHLWHKRDQFGRRYRFGSSRPRCQPSSINFSRIFNRVTPSQRAALA
jgi:hypothetical protein